VKVKRSARRLVSVTAGRRAPGLLRILSIGDRFRR
jgi:hypothetical protein